MTSQKYFVIYRMNELTNVKKNTKINFRIRHCVKSGTMSRKKWQARSRNIYIIITPLLNFKKSDNNWNRNMNVVAFIYINSKYKYIYCFYGYFCMNPSFFFIENLKIKFQKRYVLYSSGNLNFPICTCILMKMKWTNFEGLILKVAQMN